MHNESKEVPGQRGRESVHLGFAIDASQAQLAYVHTPHNIHNRRGLNLLQVRT